MSCTSNDLSTILTPSLFTFLLRNRIPFVNSPPPLDFNKVNAFFFRGQVDPSLDTALHDHVFPILQRLSEIPDLCTTDLLAYLPQPSSSKFPPQALGLLLLLDQAPRTLFTGMNVRWCNGFFDLIAIKLARQYLELSHELRPWNKRRWISELGYSFDHWIVVSIWFIAPFTHSETLSNHDISSRLVSNLKNEMEHCYNLINQDPYAATEDIWKHDVFTFPKEARNGGPIMDGDKIERQDFVWWLRMLFDAHRPIVERFGRYPYRNGGLGRVSTEEEVRYSVETGKFGETGDPEADRKVREDVVNGRWSPLVE